MIYDVKLPVVMCILRCDVVVVTLRQCVDVEISMTLWSLCYGSVLTSRSR